MKTQSNRCHRLLVPVALAAMLLVAVVTGANTLHPRPNCYSHPGPS